MTNMDESKAARLVPLSDTWSSDIAHGRAIRERGYADLPGALADILGCPTRVRTRQHSTSPPRTVNRRSATYRFTRR